VPSELDEGHLLTRSIDSDRKLVLPPQPSLPTFPAVENEDDHQFLDHYINKTSQILSMNDAEEGNPWTELLLPMAKDDQALMHSVLALAGSHLVRTSRIQRLRDRQMFHVGAALSALRRRLSETTPGDSNSELIMASMILQFLMSKNDASPSHSPQAHLKAAQTFLQAPDTPFWRFAWSFCTYHEFSTTFSSLPGPDPRPNFELVDAQATGADAGTAANGAMRQHFSILVGVVDVSFMTLISKITMLRDQVRQRQVQGILPSVHFSMLITADELGRDIAQWQSGQPAGTARHVAAELYRRASLLYLLRTVRAAASPESRSAFATYVQQGLECLQLLPNQDPVQSGLLLPTFILGCGAFEAKHRTALGLALDTIEAYSGFGNVKPVRDILRHVWATMDAGDVERSWDWETLTQEMGYAALIT
jgi:Fungal specific transcription factor domain